MNDINRLVIDSHRYGGFTVTLAASQYEGRSSEIVFASSTLEEALAYVRRTLNTKVSGPAPAQG